MVNKKNMKKSVKVFTKKKKDSNPWMIISGVLAVLLVISLFTGVLSKPSVNSLIEDLASLKTTTANQELKQELSDFEKVLDSYKEVEEKQPSSTKIGDSVKLDFYVMSQCPYGTQVEDAIQPVLEKLGDNVEFNLNFISTDLGSGQFKSLHGEPETQGNIVQLCAAKYNPDEYMDMIVCQNKNARAIPGNWEACAKDFDMNVASIKTCFESDEGKQLLSESVLKSNAVGASGSPTIYLNNQLYQGGRGETDFLKAICNAYGEERPEACSNIPVPKEVKLTIVNDKRCKTCDTTQIVGALTNMFPGLKPATVDVSSSEGKVLVSKFGITNAPSYILGSNVASEDAYTSNPQLQSIMQEVDGEYKIQDQATGAEWIIDDVKRDAYLESLKVPQTAKPEVELFVMSHCPYGTQSEKGILPAVRELGDSIDFKIRFVYYVMHGQKEVDEQLNQYCIQKEQEDVYLDYLACFLKDESGSATCMSETGVDVAKMNTCVAAADTEFGISTSFADKASWLSGQFPMFNIDKDLNTKYGVGGSPTFVINGKQSSAGRNPQSYFAAICDAFTEKPAACAKTLSSENPSAGFGYGSAAAATAAGCGI